MWLVSIKYDENNCMTMKYYHQTLSLVDTQLYSVEILGNFYQWKVKNHGYMQILAFEKTPLMLQLFWATAVGSEMIHSRDVETNVGR